MHFVLDEGLDPPRQGGEKEIKCGLRQITLPLVSLLLEMPDGIC